MIWLLNSLELLISRSTRPSNVPAATEPSLVRWKIGVGSVTACLSGPDIVELETDEPALGSDGGWPSDEGVRWCRKCVPKFVGRDADMFSGERLKELDQEELRNDGVAAEPH